MKKLLLNSLAFVFTFLTVYTVNSACMLCIGQEEEPSSLSRFKKH